MMHDLKHLLAVARGDEPADLLFRGGRVVNVLAGEIHEADLVVSGGTIVALDLEHRQRAARAVVDVSGRLLCPGFVDAHMHIESTLLAPERFAWEAARRGTAIVIADPHEIANVLGLEGVRYMLAATEGLPLSIYMMAPSCVPATHMETAGASLDASDIAALLADYPERVPGLGEVMNFPGVIHGDDEILDKLSAAAGRVIDGHAPFLSGSGLDAYILAGPSSDHESTTLTEAREKLRKGMQVLLRQGTAEHNLQELAPLVTPQNAHRFAFASDDRHPPDLAANGHVDHCLRLAVASGIDPVLAVQMATLHPCRHYGLHRRGALAPGWRADVVIVDDLESFVISGVYLEGTALDEADFASRATPPASTMHLDPDEVSPDSFRVPAPAESSAMRVLGVVPGQIVTEARQLPPTIEAGLVVADPGRDLAKLAVLDRHTGSGRIGLGFIQGLGVVAGALASTVAHDSHNLIVAGVDDEDMALAARQAVRQGGGFVIAGRGEVLAKLSLSIAGLMSDASLAELLRANEDLATAWRAIARADAPPDPFMTLSFMALPVIPELKLTDQGLVDVTAFRHTGMWVERNLK
jgi:adenine deaminase